MTICLTLSDTSGSGVICKNVPVPFCFGAIFNRPSKENQGGALYLLCVWACRPGVCCWENSSVLACRTQENSHSDRCGVTAHCGFDLHFQVA